MALVGQLVGFTRLVEVLFNDLLPVGVLYKIEDSVAAQREFAPNTKFLKPNGQSRNLKVYKLRQ
mgnify:CR=1 FL=1